MNITETLVLRVRRAFWERQRSWRELFKWIFAFAAIVTVLSGILYAGSGAIPKNSWKDAKPRAMKASDALFASWNFHTGGQAAAKGDIDDQDPDAL